MDIVDVCPKCKWEPDSPDSVIAYGKKKYSYSLSLESSFPQYEWTETHHCPNCGTEFMISVESC